MLICTNCRSVINDPGGDLRLYRCGVCGHASLVRVSNQASNNSAMTGAVVGGTLGGVAAGPIGALLGLFIGGVVGDRLNK